MTSEPVNLNELIDGDRFQALAEFSYANDDNACLAYLKARSNPSITLYADTHDSHRLMRLISHCPELSVILITHNSDGGVRASDIRTHDADIHQLPDNVRCWFAQNVEAADPRLIPIPIGLERGRWFPEVRKTEKLFAMNSSSVRKEKLLYVNHNVATNPAHRRPIYELFEKRSWATCRSAPNGVDYETYLRDIRRHHFTISPFGNGLDCHRTWEVLYLGGIPIVPRCYCHEKLYGDLPVLLVEDYEEVTESFLCDHVGLLAERTLDKARFSYYRELIAAASVRLSAPSPV